MFNPLQPPVGLLTKDPPLGVNPTAIETPVVTGPAAEDVAATVFSPERLMELEAMGFDVPASLRSKATAQSRRIAFNPLTFDPNSTPEAMLKRETAEELAFRYDDLDVNVLMEQPQGVLDDIAIRRTQTITKPMLRNKPNPDGSFSNQTEIVMVEQENPEWTQTKSLFRRGPDGEVVPEQQTDLFLLGLSTTGNERAAEVYNKLFTIDDAIEEIEQARVEGMPVSSNFARQERMKMVDELITLGYTTEEIEQLIRQHRSLLQGER